MAILIASNEGESAPEDSALTTTVATVDRRGALLAPRGWTRYFYLQSPVPHFFITGAWKKAVNGGLPYGIASNSTNMIEVFDEFGNTLCTVRADQPQAAAWSVTLACWDGATNTYKTSAYTIFPVGELFTVARRLSIDIGYDEPAGFITFKLYVDNVLVYKSEVDLAVTMLGRPVRGSWGTVRMAGIDTAYDMYIYDMLVADSNAIGVRLTTLQGSSGGYYADADGTYVGVSEVGVNVSTGITFHNVGDRASWFLTPIAGKDFTGSAIGGLSVGFLAARGESAAATGFQPFIRIGGVDYPIGSPIGLTTEATYHILEVPLNPATGLGWTATTITAGVEFGLQAVVV